MVYDDLGAGDAIVFIHGQPFNRSMWDYQSTIFSENYRLIIPDLRGYGESEVKTGVVLLDELALDIIHLLETLEINKAFFVGLSMGGQVALEIFRMKPLLFKGLVLADTDARAETEEGYTNRMTLAQTIEEYGMAKFISERINKFMCQHTFDNKPDVVTHLEKMILTTRPEGSAAAQRGRAERRDHTNILQDIFFPTLIIVGDQDEFTPIESANYMHSRIPGSELKVISQSGHIPPMEQPEEFNNVLKKFLENIKF
ncbi:MAG: alpha/beta fold hydrolase [Chitinophagaceae bacterium]